MKSIRLLLSAICTVLVCALASCESDNSLSKQPPAQSDVDMTKEFLVGDIVLSTRATLDGEDKTLLEGGCPTKFGFSWREDDYLVLSLIDFHVGAMPFDISFRCACKLMKPNSWEKEEYPEDGWVKFSGKDGLVFSSPDEQGDSQKGSGATVEGFYNVFDKKIQFIINYNMMNVRSECFTQIVNKDRINHFDEEFAKYEEDLRKYKEDHNL